MTTKRKARTAWSLAECLERLGSIGAGSRSDLDVEKRRKLREGRSVADLDVIAMAIPMDAAGRLLLYRLAEEDHTTAKAARLAGKPIPALPFLDALKGRNAEMVSTKSTTSGRKSTGGATRKVNEADVQFWHDGKIVSPTQNKLSSVAWFYTKGIGAGGGRLKVGELKALLARDGVADPHKAGWSVKLSNGITIGTVKKGDPVPSVDVKPKIVTAAKDRSREALADGSIAKAVAKKTAKKAPAAKKSTAKKAAPKKSTAKKGAASAPLSKPPVPRKSTQQPGILSSSKAS